jgi:hypothetical protein
MSKPVTSVAHSMKGLSLRAWIVDMLFASGVLTILILQMSTKITALFAAAENSKERQLILVR